VVAGPRECLWSRAPWGGQARWGTGCPLLLGACVAFTLTVALAVGRCAPGVGLVGRRLETVFKAVKEAASVCLVQCRRLFRSRRLRGRQPRLLAPNADANGRLHILQLQRPLFGRLVLGRREVIVDNGRKLDVGQRVLAACIGERTAIACGCHGQCGVVSRGYVSTGVQDRHMSSGTALVHPSCGSVAFPRASECSDGHKPEHGRLIADGVIASPESKGTRHWVSMTTSANGPAGKHLDRQCFAFPHQFPHAARATGVPPWPSFNHRPFPCTVHHQRPRTSFVADPSVSVPAAQRSGSPAAVSRSSAACRVGVASTETVPH
jgi:hypothetical protein